MTSVTCQENRTAYRFSCDHARRVAALVIDGSSIPVTILNYSAGGFLIEVEAAEKIETESAWLITNDEKILVHFCHQSLKEDRLYIGLQRMKSIPRQISQPHDTSDGLPISDKNAETGTIGAAMVVICVLIAAIAAGVMLNFHLQTNNDNASRKTASVGYSAKASTIKLKLTSNDNPLSNLFRGKKSPGLFPAKNRSRNDRKKQPSPPSRKSASTKRKQSFAIDIPWSNDNTGSIKRAASADMIDLSQSLSFITLDRMNALGVEQTLKSWLAQHQGEELVFRIANGNHQAPGELKDVPLKIDYASIRQLSQAIDAAPESWDEFVNAVELYLLNHRQLTASSLGKQVSPVQIPSRLIPKKPN